MPRSYSVRLLLALVVTVVVVSVCLWPKSWMPAYQKIDSVEDLNLDKLVHFGLYAAFGLSWTLANRGGSSIRPRVAWVIAAGVALAVVTELAQGTAFVDRDPNLLDGLANIAGVVVATLMAARRGAGAPARGSDGSPREFRHGTAAVGD